MFGDLDGSRFYKSLGFLCHGSHFSCFCLRSEHSFRSVTTSLPAAEVAVTIVMPDAKTPKSMDANTTARAES
jgi:hypothetical protein